MQRDNSSVNLNKMADVEGTEKYMAPELRVLYDNGTV
jgi:hypothetical protein